METNVNIVSENIFLVNVCLDSKYGILSCWNFSEVYLTIIP